MQVVRAVTTAVRWLFNARGAVAVVARTAALVAINAVASKLAAAKAKDAAQAAQGVEQQRQGGATTRRAVAIGPCVVFGSEAALLASGNGDDNKTNWRALVCSDWPCKAKRVWVNGQQLTFDGDINTGWRACNQYRSKAGQPRVWMRFLTGDWEQLADSELIASGGFGSDDRLRGCATLIIKREYDADAFPNGPPDGNDLRVEVDEAPLYDWRDTEQVLTDVRTWKPSTNPVVVTENLLCLIRAPAQFSPGTTDPIVGPGLKWERRGGRAAFRATLTAMANICDALVGGVPRYRVALVVRSDQMLRDVLQLIADACGGDWISAPTGGYLVPGHVPPPCRTITTAEYQAGAAVSWEPWEAPDQAINTLQVTGPDLDRAGELDTVTVVDAAAVIADGGELSAQLDLSACPWPEQRWRVAWRRYRAERLGDVRRFTVPARHMDLLPLDVIEAPDPTLPSDVSGAWWQIRGIQQAELSEGHTIALTLRRVAASIDGAVPEMGATADFDPPPLANELAVPTITVTADPLTGSDGSVQPRWRLVLAASAVQARARVELQGPAATAGAIAAAPIQIVDLARGDSRPVVAAAGWWRWRAAGRDANGRTGPLGAWSSAAQLTQGVTASGVPWSGVINDGGRPENNATVGARIGTNLVRPDNSVIPVQQVDNAFVSPATSGYVADLAAQRFAPNRLAAAHFSNLATLPGVTPILVNSLDQEAWNGDFFRNEFLPRVFGSLDVRRFIFTMCEWTGYWWLPLGTKLTSYPRSHAIAWNGVAPFGAWWHNFAGSATVQNTDNILIALQEAGKWRERGVVIGTGRGDDMEHYNDTSRIVTGVPGLSNLTLSVAGPAGAFGSCSTTIDTFLDDDLGWLIRGPNGVGLAEIINVVGPRLVGYRVIEPFAGTSITAGTWRKMLRDPLTNGAQLWFSATGTGTRTAKTSLPSFNAFQVGQRLYNRFGPGMATITAVTNSSEVQVDVTQDFGTQAVFPHTWNITGVLPLTGGMTIAQRRTKVATETLQIIAQAIETYGAFDTLVGFYLGHEPDDAAASAPLIRMICKEGAGGWPPLESYRRPNGAKYEFWVSPASPIDCQTDEGCLAAGAALADTGLTHWHPQDTTGAGSDLVTGQPLWDAGVEANLAGLPEMARRMRIVASRANCLLPLHNEAWRMTGPNYADATPAPPDRYARQVAAYGSRGDFAAHYQLCGYFNLSVWTIQPRQVQAGIVDFATRANALSDIMIKMVGSPSIVAAGPAATVQKRAFATGITVPTGAAWTTLVSVTFQEAPLAGLADLGGTLVTGAAGTGNITAELRLTKDGALVPGSGSGSFLAISGGIMTAEWTIALETTAGVFPVAPGAGVYALQARIVSGGAMSNVNTTIDVGVQAQM